MLSEAIYTEYQIKKLVAQRIMVKTKARLDRPGPPFLA